LNKTKTIAFEEASLKRLSATMVFFLHKTPLFYSGYLAPFKKQNIFKNQPFKQQNTQYQMGVVLKITN